MISNVQMVICSVHLVPHTHDDTGWQVTVDQCELFYNQCSQLSMLRMK